MGQFSDALTSGKSDEAGEIQHELLKGKLTPWQDAAWPSSSSGRLGKKEKALGPAGCKRASGSFPDG